MTEFRWDIECPTCSTRPGGSFPRRVPHTRAPGGWECQWCGSVQPEPEQQQFGCDRPRVKRFKLPWGRSPFVDDVSVFKMTRNGTTQASSSGLIIKSNIYEIPKYSVNVYQYYKKYSNQQSY